MVVLAVLLSQAWAMQTPGPNPALAAKPVLKSRRTWTLTYPNCRVPKGNEVRTPDGFTYFPVPEAPDGSVRTKKVDLFGVSDRKTARAEGITLELFRVATERSFSLSIEVDVDVLDYRGLLADSRFPSAWPMEVVEFLGTSQSRFHQKKNIPRIDPRSAIVRRAAAGLRKTTPLETVKAILGWLKNNLRYDTTEHFSVDEVIQRGFGECGAYSATFAALARACGIPARDVWGLTNLPDGEKTEKQLAGHAWAEVFFDGIGWVQVEPQSPESLGLIPDHYIRVCHFAPKSSAFPWYALPNELFVVFAGRHPGFKFIPHTSADH